MQRHYHLNPVVTVFVGHRSPSLQSPVSRVCDTVILLASLCVIFHQPLPLRGNSLPPKGLGTNKTGSIIASRYQ